MLHSMLNYATPTLANLPTLSHSFTTAEPKSTLSCSAMWMTTNL